MGKAWKQEWLTAIVAHSRPLAHIWMSLEAEERQESPLAANFKAGSPVSISPEHGEGTEGPSLGLLPATTENAEGPGGSKECMLWRVPDPHTCPLQATAGDLQLGQDFCIPAGCREVFHSSGPSSVQFPVGSYFGRTGCLSGGGAAKGLEAEGREAEPASMP